jgi:ATP-binding cassette subfamily B protein
MVLHEGQLVESGTHDELMTRGGRYAHFQELQSGAATNQSK